MHSFSSENLLSYKKSLKFWWLLVLGGIMGAMLGLALNLTIVKPIYTSRASISAVINFYQVGHLTQYEQDQYIGHLITFLKSSEILDETISGLSDQGIQIDRQTFAKTCFIERNLNEIVLRCADPSAQLAKTYVEHWERVGFRSLANALTHARKYDELLLKQDQIQKCLETSALTVNSGNYCNLQTEDLEQLSAETKSEFEQSKGMFSGISILEGSAPLLPEHPVRNNMNLLVLGGAVFGLIISISFLFTRITPK
jgi:capsular polysaccharide biosynthesis protein